MFVCGFYKQLLSKFIQVNRYQEKVTCYLYITSSIFALKKELVHEFSCQSLGRIWRVGWNSNYTVTSWYLVFCWR